MCEENRKITLPKNYAIIAINEKQDKCLGMDDKGFYFKARISHYGDLFEKRLVSHKLVMRYINKLSINLQGVKR